MKLKAVETWTVGIGLAIIVAIGACGKGSPAQPSSTGVSGSTFVAPQPVSPAANALIPFFNQPVTLAVTNAVTTGSAALIYTFEVATDADFSNLAFHKEGVAQGSGGQTTLKIDALGGNKTYYWRTRPSGGPNSAARSFIVGPPVSLSTPSLASPASGGTVGGTVVLSVTNVARTGPAGQLTYRFDVSDSSSFNNLVFTTLVAEQGGAGAPTSTAIPSSANLKANVTYFWRAQAIDQQNGITTPFSSTSTFTVQLFDMRQATIVDGPSDLGFWNETATITAVVFTGDEFAVDFDRRDGPNRWRDLEFAPGATDTLQYSLGICGNIGGHWYCSAPIQFWYGREFSASAPPWAVSAEWFYDHRWGAMFGYQPQDGELVGLFAGTGNLRGSGWTGATCPQICERTNVALVEWHNYDFQAYTFPVLTPHSVAHSVLNLLKRR